MNQVEQKARHVFVLVLAIVALLWLGTTTYPVATRLWENLTQKRTATPVVIKKASEVKVESPNETSDH